MKGALKGALMVMKVPKGKLPKAVPEDRFVSGVDKQQGGWHHTYTLPLDCPLFELTEVGAAHWVVMDAWTLHEAALLLSGADPKRVSEFDKDASTPKPDLSSCGYVGIFDRLSRASEVGVLLFPAAPLTVCEWASKKHGIPASLRVALASHSGDGSRGNQVRGVTYSYPLFPRLQALTPWRGGRTTDTDVLTLEEAARMATRHAGEEVTVADVFRAAGRGEIPLRAVVHRSAKVQRYNGGVYCNKGTENENVVPSGSIPTLPLTACQHLAAGGRASWRTFDGYEEVNGTLMRFTEAMLTNDEPDFETVPADCRVTGNDIHALADAFCEAPAQPQAAMPARLTECASNAPLPLATREIAACFDGIRWSEREWKKPLGDKPKWLRPCVAIPGQQGVSETRWDPVKIAAWLVHNEYTQARSIRARFQTKPLLRPWLEEWKTYEADNFDTQ